MKKFTVYLNTIDKVKDFVRLMESFSYDIDLVSDRFTVDAKSIMGIFSLNLGKPAEVVIHTEDENEIARFEETIKKFTA